MVLLAAFIALSVSTRVAATEENQTPPDFPACTSYSEPGDWQHYDSGVHQIVGNGLVEGVDDVYTFGEHFVQCLCPPDYQGIQTNWWRTDSVFDGWFSESGSQWNLGDYHYLAQNIDYDCSEPEPTPTPTPGNGGNGGNGGDKPECPASSPTAAPVVSAFRSSPTSVVLTWNSVGPLTHYSLRYGTSPGNYEYGATNIGDVIMYEVKDLEPNKPYYFQIAGVNDCAAGHWSNEVGVNGKVLGIAHEPVAAGLSGLNLVGIASSLAAAGAVLFLLSKFTKRNYLLDR